MAGHPVRRLGLAVATLGASAMVGVAMAAAPIPAAPAAILPAPATIPLAPYAGPGARPTEVTYTYVETPTAPPAPVVIVHRVAGGGDDGEGHDD